MNNTLKLGTEVFVAGTAMKLPFPGPGQDWAYISDYKYSATRMSSAPSITATLKWPRCLDKEWTESVFVEYKGERYFVKNTPSSSYDNTSRLYSHELNLVSERAVLDTVYFLNVPTKTSDEGENVQGDSLSNSPEFSFSGDINEFVDRLNRSLVQSGIGGELGYTAFADKGTVSETRLFSVSKQYVTDALKSAYELYGVPYYFVGKEIHFGAQQNDIQTPLRYGANDSLLSISKTNLNKQVVTRITGYGSSRNIPYYYPNPTPKGKIYLESTSNTAIFEVKDDMLFCNNMDLDRWIEYTGVDYSVDIEKFSASSDGETYNSHSSSDLFNAELKKNVWIKFNFYVEHDFTDTYIDCSFATTDRGVRPLKELYVDSALMGKDGAIQTKFVDGMVHCGKLTKATYTMTLHLRYVYAGSTTYEGYFRIKNLNKALWRIDGTEKTFDLNKASIYITSGVPKHGDRIKQSLEYRIDVKNALMPSVYRRTRGENMWYNATNDPDRGDWYGNHEFNHPYNSKRPAEYIHSDDKIYPTIKGMTNARNESIDTFLDIAFDEYDNNEIYPEDYEDEKLAGKYKHPYFFVKLKKTDGPNGFNLFDHAIENEPMKISFTSGHVAGCEFEIGVDEDTQKNPVQVDENGDLVRDENYDVVIRGSYIDSQQDTQNNEVWLALKKEDSTMGALMPDAAAGLIPLGDLSPNGGDTFVILGIHLPEAYITAAEDRLERELLEYLYDNNDERFSFSIKFSSIYLAENPKLASIINENCRVRLIYDDVEYAMFATSCSITVKEGVALPEVTLNIDNELKLVKPKVKDVSAIIAATEKKIKEVKDSTAEVRTNVLGANISTKDNAEKIRQLQEEKVSEDDLESLEYNINGQSGLYNTKENVKVPAFYAATDAGTKSQILQSTGLGAPKWVDLSDVGVAIKFANDLTGVIEATAEEFTYRPSAGNKSIHDASAVIRRIKGNSLVLNQLATFKDNWSENGLTCVKEGNTIHLYGTVTEAFSYDTCRLTNYLSQGLKRDGRKYLISMNAPDGVAYGINGYTIKDTKPHFWSDKADSVWYGYISIKIPVGTTVDYVFSDPQIIDLTRMFDTGNEPTTIDDFYTRISKDIDINTYNEGEIISMIVNAIETTGFNQWDERWELGALATNTGGPVANHERGRSVNFFDVIPNATYYCATIAPTTTNSSGTEGSIAVFWYDSNQNFIKYADITNNTCVAPSNARYAKICTWGGDVNAIFNSGVNINLSHSGVRDGEYEPYKRNIRLLPEIYKYFPDGMNGNANVWDEINAEKAIKRWGVVDLGTLTWSTQGTNTSGEYRWEAKGISTPPTATTATIPNIICAKYTTGSNENTWARRDGVSISASGNIRIFDSQYKEASSKEAFVASLQGVLLYYELAEPIETPITEAIQLDYEVYDFGTEKASAFGNSAPFRADIVYQFNAEGRIRDNSRNIERVESTVTTRLIPSQSAMLGLPNKVMIWDGHKTLMSLPIAEDIDHWELDEYPYGALPTGEQVKNYVRAITGKLIPTESAPFETQNRVMIWNGDYAMTSLPIAANFAQWEAGAIPTGQQVIDYISNIKGGLAVGLITKGPLTILANGPVPISPNIVYEFTTKSSTTYNVGFHIVTTQGVDVVADNEWRIRIDTRNGFSGSIVFEPLAGYSIRWAYPEASGAGTAPNITAGYIWDIQFRMIGRTLLGSYKKY